MILQYKESKSHASRKATSFPKPLLVLPNQGLMWGSFSLSPVQPLSLYKYTTQSTCRTLSAHIFSQKIQPEVVPDHGLLNGILEQNGWPQDSNEDSSVGEWRVWLVHGCRVWLCYVYWRQMCLGHQFSIEMSGRKSWLQGLWHQWLLLHFWPTEKRQRLAQDAPCHC